MLFNSFQFLLFFPIVVTIYFILPHRFRWILLLVASYYFYMCWKAEYIILIIVSTLIDYFAGIMMERSATQAGRRKFLILSLCSNLGLLFMFKYFNFFNDSLRIMFDKMNIFYGVPAFKLLLPVGISFYTFQTLSYSIDVYRGKQKAEHNLGIFALYVSFFPQLVAGPIERSVQLLPQFFRKHTFDYVRVTDGLKLMMWGFFKKIVIADRLALFVNQIYSDPAQYPGFPLILGTYFFAFQIYCDFSGYSDIAIGASQVMGFNLMDNFNRPYFSKSISEFWRRWHISLSSWFKDYLYFSLGGSRVSKWRWYFNLFAVFMVSGMWHGANWTFIVWGMLHGFYLIFAIWTHNIRKKTAELCRIDKAPFIQKCLKVFVTFHLVLISWMFFRANSISEAFQIMRLCTVNVVQSAKELYWGFCGFDSTYFIVSILLIGFMETLHLIQRHSSIRHMLSKRPLWVRWLIYYAVILAMIFLGVYEKVEFIYFQF